MSDLQEKSKELLQLADAAYVTTVNQQGFPETRAMFNLRRTEQFPGLTAFFAGEDDFTVYLTTNTSSRKIAQLADNARTSVYYCRTEDWRGLNLIGEMTIVNDRAVRERLWQKGWELYYPAGPDDPDYCVLMMKPTEARYYHQLETVVFAC